MGLTIFEEVDERMVVASIATDSKLIESTNFFVLERKSSTLFF